MSAASLKIQKLSVKRRESFKLDKVDFGRREVTGRLLRQGLLTQGGDEEGVSTDYKIKLLESKVPGEIADLMIYNEKAGAKAESSELRSPRL